MIPYRSISFFERIVAGSRADSTLKTGRDVAGPVSEKEPTTTGPDSPTVRGRTVFFFVDDMHLSADSMIRAKDLLMRFVTERMGDADRVAVTSASGQLGFLQQLTSDKSVVTMAIEKLRPRPYPVTDMQAPPMTEYHARDRESGRIGSAVQWLEIPKTIQDSFSMSSIFLSEGPPSSQGTAQKWIIKPDRTFSRTSKFKFQSFVYNADLSGSAPRLQLQLELRREGQVLVQTPPTAVSTEGTDFKRVPIIGEFPLGDFAAGRYEIKLVLTDLKTKSAVSQQANFTIN